MPHRFNRLTLSLCILSVVTCTTLPSRSFGQAAGDALAQAWEDFAHYVQVAQVELANANGQVLLNSDGQALLTAVEASRHAKNADRIIDRAMRTEQLKDIGEGLYQKLQTAKLQRAREPQRIIDDINRLGTGERAYQNAIVRLREAGQWIAPHILVALQDEDKKSLHPTLMRAMREVGLPLVAPLSTALPSLEPVTQAQVGQVLQEIGYARALPYMLEVLEDPSTDAYARQRIKVSYDKLADRHSIPVDVRATDLYLLLGQNLYRTGTNDPTTLPGYDELETMGIVWRFNRIAGLVGVRVPGPIFADVLAMDAGRASLKLDPTMDQSLSLWLAANLRRQNRLPEGANDPTYPASRWQDPAFYAQTAGALRLHDVLARALQDQDPALALDAINGLGAIAGPDTLINREGTIQPLLWALSYPDRRVRFHAAFVLTNSKPMSPLEGSQRVVPVLAEAVRQSEQRSVVVVAPAEVTGKMNSILIDELGIQPITGTTLESLADPIAASPGADLLIIRAGVDDLEKILNEASLDYKLASVPVIGIVPINQGIEANRRFARLIEARRLWVAPASDETIDKDLLEANIKEAQSIYVGTAIEAAEAEQLALQSLALLREVALTRCTDVFRLQDAQPALTSALADPREKVAAQAAAVLSLMPRITGEDIPFLGCCYGIGILGKHLGGDVSKRAHGEPVGTADCTLTEDGAADPLLAGLPARFTAFVGHKEALQALPEGCTHLVASPRCPYQMIRHGRHVYATQFHPEADAAGFETRIRIYRNKGYFAPETADDLIAMCRAAQVHAPERILRRFVARYGG